MKKKLNCILLIDDNPDDNFFHEREIKKNDIATHVITKNSGSEALSYIKSQGDNMDMRPDLIFLDINMPGMNGWEFLEQYELLDKELQSGIIIVMLTTSENPDDIARAMKWSFVCDYVAKPLSKERMEGIVSKYFN